MTKRLPPFGKRFQPVPRSGVCVAIGIDAWQFQKDRQRLPIIVLPENSCPTEFDWPMSPDNCAIVFETGSPNDMRLDAVADALIRFGHRFITAIRTSQFGKRTEPYVYFEANYV